MFVFFVLGFVEIAQVLIAIFTGPIIAGTLSVVVCGYAAYRLVSAVYRVIRTVRYAAVTPSGVRARSLSGSVSVGWDDFDYLQMHGFIPTIFLRKPPYRAMLFGIFDSRRSFDAFDEAVESGLMRYRTAKAKGQ